MVEQRGGAERCGCAAAATPPSLLQIESSADFGKLASTPGPNEMGGEGGRD